MMTNGDTEGRIFLSYPHTFLAHHCFYLFIYLFMYSFIYLFILFIYSFIYFIYLFIYLFYNKLPEITEYVKLQFHVMTLLDVLGKIAWVR